MQDSSLKKTSEAIAEMLETLNIPLEDKIELLINLNKFLKAKEYRENIEILRTHQRRR